MRLRITIPPTSPRTLVRFLFLAVGIGCLGVYGFAWLQRVVYQHNEDQEFDRTVMLAPFRAKPEAVAPAANALIGRLTVPRLHLSAIVREGVDRTTLRLAVGHIPATALPGQVGNIGVAGHRDTFFRGLKDLRTTDRIQFSTTQGDFEYIVDSLRVVNPENVSVLASSSEKVLTLVTCFPFWYIGSAPKRFIVRARQVPSETAPRLVVN